jgi:hypothetical protein
VAQELTTRRFGAGWCACVHLSVTLPRHTFDLDISIFAQLHGIATHSCPTNDVLPAVEVKLCSAMTTARLWPSNVLLVLFVVAASPDGARGDHVQSSHGTASFHARMQLHDLLDLSHCSHACRELVQAAHTSLHVHSFSPD